MPNDIKTDSQLLHRLKIARQLSGEQLRRQRVSFIYGSLPKNSTITRPEIERVLAEMDGEAA